MLTGCQLAEWPFNLCLEGSPRQTCLTGFAFVFENGHSTRRRLQRMKKMLRWWMGGEQSIFMSQSMEFFFVADILSKTEQQSQSRPYKVRGNTWVCLWWSLWCRVNKWWCESVLCIFPSLSQNARGLCANGVPVGRIHLLGRKGHLFCIVRSYFPSNYKHANII